MKSGMRKRHITSMYNQKFFLCHLGLISHYWIWLSRFI